MLADVMASDKLNYLPLALGLDSISQLMLGHISRHTVGQGLSIETLRAPMKRCSCP